jgi:hypothetical protein
MGKFDDIRPYEDSEVTSVLQRLIHDDEFLGFLTLHLFPRLGKVFPPIAKYLVRSVLKKQTAGIASIGDFQNAVAEYAERLVSHTMDGFEFSGVDQLKKTQAYLFVGNHRDIAGDSMLVDYALHLSGHETVRIAVGDNLVQKQFATDLMKLNKSFFIKRSEEGAKKVYAALMASSEFIHESLRSGNSIWIAQSEGRAKNGIDVTDPTILKMFALARRKDDLSEVVCDLNIVPVSIAYEFDPCDLLKAKELDSIARSGTYQKPSGEDLLSLAKGLGEYKGRVCLKFGTPLGQGYDTPEAVAKEIDRQVLGNLQMFAVNYWALAVLAGEDKNTIATSDLVDVEDALLPLDPIYFDVWSHVKQLSDLSDVSNFESRLMNCPSNLRLTWLTMYANPLVNKFRNGAKNITPYPNQK